MSRKQFHKQVVGKSMEELFERFVASQAVKGISEKTIETYQSHLRCIAKPLDLAIPIQKIKEKDDTMNLICKIDNFMLS